MKLVAKTCAFSSYGNQCWLPILRHLRRLPLRAFPIYE